MDEFAKSDAPEFRTREDVEAWLKDKPREWSVVLAARAALRVLPVISAEIRENPLDTEYLPGLMFTTATTFRAAATAWGAARYPNHRIAGVGPTVILANAPDAGTRDAAFSALVAAATPATDAYFLSAARAISDASDAALAYSTDSESLRFALSQDVSILQDGRAPSALAAEPLWLSTAPDWATNAWTRLRDALPEGEHWEVWTDWYAARLKKSRWSKKKALIYASMPLNVLERGYIAANTWIYEELQKLKLKKTLETDDASPKLVGTHVFVVADGQIDAHKDDGRPDFPAVARSFYETARRRAQELAERVKRWQADTKLEGKVAQLLEHLTENPDEATLGYLIASMLALQAEHRNWDNEEGRKEIPLDLLTLLDETAEAVASYVSGFEIGHKILASRLAFDLKIERGALERVQAATQEIKAIAQASPVVKPSVVEALDAPVRAVRNARDDKERAEQLALGLNEVTGFLRAATKGVAGFVFRTVKKIDEKGPDAIADGFVMGAKLLATAAVLSTGFYVPGLGEGGLKLLKAALGPVRTIGSEVRPGGPIQKLEKQMRESVEAAERAASAEPPVAEAPRAKTPRSSKPKAPRKKK